MKKELKLSLIIPAHNEEKYIRACLDCALKQTVPFSEIIVVDNDSTDGTQKVVREFEGVKLVEESHKGVMRARQRGVVEAKGDVICFVDADNRMAPDWAERVRKEFSHDESVVCVSGPYIYHYDSKLHEVIANFFFWYVMAMPVYFLVGYMAIFGNMAIRKSVLEKMGGLDTSIEFYGDDTNTARRANAFGKVKFVFSLKMSTSNRRLVHQGTFRTVFLYVANFLSEVFLKKPAHKKYKDFR